MPFLDEMKDKLSQVSQSAKQRAREASDTAKFNTAISDAERQITELYEKIGRETYRICKDSPPGEVAELINQVTKLKLEIDECRENIKAIHAARICPHCGARIHKEMSFCSNCGFELPHIETPTATGEGRCSACGAVLAADALFCTACGKRVETGGS